MSVVPTYTYDFKFPFHLKGVISGDTVRAPGGDTAIIENIVNGMNATAAEKFAENMAPTGHWYRINNTVTTCTITDKRMHLMTGASYDYTFDGMTVLNFDTDVADPKAHSSPQLVAVLTAILAAVVVAIITQPIIFLIIIAVIVFTIGAYILINTGTGAITTIGSNVGALVLALAILGVTGLGIYALFFTKKGQKATSKGYQLGRRTYRAVRRRT